MLKCNIHYKNFRIFNIPYIQDTVCSPFFIQKVSIHWVIQSQTHSIAHCLTHSWAEFLCAARDTMSVSLWHTQNPFPLSLSFSQHILGHSQSGVPHLSPFCFLIWRQLECHSCSDQMPHTLECSSLCPSARQEPSRERQLWVPDGFGNEERHLQRTGCRRSAGWAWADGPCWDHGKQKESEPVSSYSLRASTFLVKIHAVLLALISLISADT